MKGLSNYSQFSALISIRDYRWYVIGNFSSTIGLWMQRVALGYLVWELTKSPGWLGLIALAETGPTIVLGFVSGALLERLNPLYALRVTQVMTVTYSTILAVLTFLHLANEWVLLVLVLIRGLIFTINRPARMTMVYHIVGRNLLPNALAFNATIFNSSKFIGPGVAGATIIGLGIGGTFVLVVLMQLVYTYSLSLLKQDGPPRHRDSNSQTNLGEEILEGLRYIAHHPGVRLQFLLLLIVAILAKPVNELLPGFANGVFGKGPEGLSFMYVMFGIGAMAGGIWLSLHASLTGLVFAGIAATICTSLALMWFASTGSFMLASALLLLVGFGSVVVGISSQTLIQSAIRSRYRGRTMSTYGMVAQGAPSLGALLMGVAGEWFGLGPPVYWGAVICLIVGIGAWFIRQKMAGLLEVPHQSHGSTSTHPAPRPAPMPAPLPATARGPFLGAPTLAAGLPIRLPEFAIPPYIAATWKNVKRIMDTHLQQPDAATVRLMGDIGTRARAAAGELALATPEAKILALRTAAAAIRQHLALILAANAKDVAAAREAGRPDSFIDRLKLDEVRIEAIAKGLEDIALLPDPVGAVLASWTRPNGMRIERVRVPIGVIGIIYESRPNVTADAGALCLKSGNAVILRGGSESHHSSVEIHECLVEGLRAAGLHASAVQLVPTTDRSAVGLMLGGLNASIDVIVPRGGKSLVERVQNEARVPVFAHLEGICHTYVDREADLDMAVAIVVNAKMRRTGVCGATETLLVDRNSPDDKLSPLVRALLEAGCEVRGDVSVQAVDDRVKPATEADWSTEYLDKIISVKTVDGVDEAIRHIARYGSQHTDCIVTASATTAERFLTRVDSAIVLHNASTQFADGGEFGFGAEIGIATGKLHARGPVGVEQLTSFKYVVRGSGQTRPG